MAELIDELAVALERMVDATCPSMRAHWLMATRRQRRDLPDAMTQHASIPPGLARFKKARRSKYEALATFRHAVVWRLPPAQWDPQTPAGQEYFSPCRDSPPFTTGGADARSTLGSRRRAQVSAQLLTLIERVRLAAREQDRARSGNDLHVAGALALEATRKTLRDVLKLDSPELSAAFDEAVEDTEWE
ncbi:MAG: hypothetical protein OXT09_23845 [Myxococcales bacterium]|nr:hypothetical protein [Myxococcales bacterium]